MLNSSISKGPSLKDNKSASSMWKCQNVLDKEGLWQDILSPPTQGVAKSGVVGPQNVLYWKHSSHTVTKSVWQQYEKEIKGIFMQHSQRELTSHLKVVYWRVLSVRLHLQRSTKAAFSEWQAGCELCWQRLGWTRWRELAWNRNKHSTRLINTELNFLTKF